MITSFMTYIDLDGILNTWMCDEVSRRIGRPFAIADWPIDLGWKIVDVVARNGGDDHRQNPMEFWETITESSWADCAKSAEFDTIIAAAVTLVGTDNVRILTTMPGDHNPAAASGKAWWCATHLPKWLQGKVITMQHGVEKGELAGPTRLLIDDGDHNYTSWTEAGGQCILFPRPWNSNNSLAFDAVPYFLNRMHSMVQEWSL
jgi:hypothetical protein